MSQFKIDPDLCKKYDIKLVYLFGSQVKGTAAEGSDFDIAVLFKKNPADPLALKEISLFTLELNKSLPAKLDVVSLNDVPTLLKYEIVAHGHPLYCENEEERINFEVSIIKKYIDEEPIRNLYNQALYKRILQET